MPPKALNKPGVKSSVPSNSSGATRNNSRNRPQNIETPAHIDNPPVQAMPTSTSIVKNDYIRSFEEGEAEQWTEALPDSQKSMDTALKMKETLSPMAFDARKDMLRIETTFTKFRTLLQRLRDTEKTDRKSLRKTEEDIKHQQELIRGSADDLDSMDYETSHTTIEQANNNIRALRVETTRVLARIEQSGVDLKILDKLLSKHQNNVEQAVDGRPNTKLSKIDCGKRDSSGIIKAKNNASKLPQPDTVPRSRNIFLDDSGLEDSDSERFGAAKVAPMAGVHFEESSSSSRPRDPRSLPPHADREAGSLDITSPYPSDVEDDYMDF